MKEEYAITVSGLVHRSELGITLPHEHLLIDFSCRYSSAPDESSLGSQPALADWKANSIYNSDDWRIARIKCIPGGDYVPKERV